MYRKKKNIALAMANPKYNTSSSCFHHHGGIICFHFLLSSTGHSPHWRNGPGWWRADLRGRSFKESRNISEQWSDGLWQTAARISRRVITAQRWPVFSPFIIHTLENVLYFGASWSELQNLWNLSLRCGFIMAVWQNNRKLHCNKSYST